MGVDETENIERRRWGTPRDFEAEGFEFKAHWDLGIDLDILDFDRGNKLSGSRFALLGGQAARLERAIINFMASTCILARGYKEWWPAHRQAPTRLARASCRSSRMTPTTRGPLPYPHGRGR